MHSNTSQYSEWTKWGEAMSGEHSVSIRGQMWPRTVQGVFTPILPRWTTQVTLLSNYYKIHNVLEQSNIHTATVLLYLASHYDLCRDSSTGRKHAEQTEQKTSSTPASPSEAPRLLAAGYRSPFIAMILLTIRHSYKNQCNNSLHYKTMCQVVTWTAVAMQVKQLTSKRSSMQVRQQLTSSRSSRKLQARMSWMRTRPVRSGSRKKKNLRTAVQM